MGYTHYFPQKRVLTAAEWSELAEKAKILIAVAEKGGVKIAGWDGTGEPRIDDKEIRLNGAGEDSFETFTLKRDGVKDGFNFTKTGRRPYDPLVCGILIVAEGIAPGAYDISSDGGFTDAEDGEWGSALVLVKKALGQSYALPVRVTE